MLRNAQIGMAMIRRKPVFSILFACLVLCVEPQAVVAQADEAKELHMAGKKAMEEADKLEHKGQHAAAQGAYAEACLKFKQALALSPKRPTTGMALALCHVAVGKPATALAQFQLAKEWAEAQGKAEGAAAASNAQVAAASTVEIKKLESIVPRLRIKVPERIKKLPGLAISENGNSIPDTKWDTDIVVDPGPITILVTATSRNPWTAQHEALLGKVTDVSITPDWKVDEPAAASNGRRTVGFIGIGVGGAALVAGTVLGSLALSKNADSKKDGHCDATNACDPIGLDLRYEAKNLGNASTAMFVVGGVLAATGIILVALPSADPKKSDSSVQASLRMGPGSIEVRGHW